MRNKNAKPLIALALTGAASALVVAFRVPDAPVVGNTTTAVVNTSATNSVATKPSATTKPATSPTTPAPATAQTGAAEPTPTATADTSGAGTASSSQYADGTYAGAAIDEPWGVFQVQVTISSGQIIDVSVVSEPDDGHSSRINSIAVPMLTESAIAAQSGNIDMVSGATWTSDSYATSLQAALDQAASAQNGG